MCAGNVMKPLVEQGFEAESFKECGSMARAARALNPLDSGGWRVGWIFVLPPVIAPVTQGLTG